MKTILTQPQRELRSEGVGGNGKKLDYLIHKDSVQVMYRPVLQLDRLPPIPQPDDFVSDSYLFWSEEIHRAQNGFIAKNGVWINPIYYWYLNHVKVEYVDEKTGREMLESPLYCDSDHETFDEIYWSLAHNLKQGLFSKGRLPIESSRNKKKIDKERKAEEQRLLEEFRQVKIDAKDLIATKGRRKHWSYNNLCGVFLWCFAVEQNGHLAIGFDCKDSREEGQRVFRGAYDRLHDFWKHAALFTDREGEISTLSYETGEDGEVRETEGYVIYFKEVDKRPGAFRGKRLRLVLFDEAGKYLNLNKLIGATRDCLRAGTIKFGTMLIGGTCDPITNKSDAYQKLWERAKALGWNKLFIPAWKVAPPNLNHFTGVSDEMAARKKYQDERQKFIDAGDTDGLHLTIQENPLDEHELFMLPTLSNYPPDQLLGNTMRIAEYGESLPVTRGRLEWIASATTGKSIGKVEFIEDPNGQWLKNNDYEPNRAIKNLDVLGIDSVYKDSAPHSDSKCAAVLYRRFNHRLDKSDYPAMMYFDRPLLDIFAEEIKKMMVFSGCRVVLEHNDQWLADQIRKERVVNNTGVMLLNDQLIYYNNEPGLRNSEQTIVEQTRLTLKWIRDGGLYHNLFMPILNGLKNWRQKNDDVASAFHLCMMGVDTLSAIEMEEDHAYVEVPDFRFGASAIEQLGLSASRGFADIERALGWSGEGIAPLGMGNGAWGNPARQRMGQVADAGSWLSQRQEGHLTLGGRDVG